MEVLISRALIGSDISCAKRNNKMKEEIENLKT